MSLRLQFRPYRLSFRSPVRTAHGRWSEREGMIVRLEDVAEGGSGAVGFGEAAPIPWFGTETIDEVLAAIRQLPEYLDAATFDVVPARLGCLRHALAAAHAALQDNATSAGTSASAQSTSAAAVPPAPAYLPVAALLPAGRAALPQLLARAEAGFRTFKWKVGVGDLADELVLLDDVCGQLPSGGKLRLDANGAWDRRRAERWLERCAERPVEFIEQPIAATERNARDLLLGLAGDYPTPLALDESLTTERDVTRWLGDGWPGVFVLKPLLVGDVTATLAQLARARADVVFSSALETAVGARDALQHAFRWAARTSTAEASARPAPLARALGFGVWPLFTDPRCDGPATAPFVRQEDLAHLDPEAVWNALS